MRLEKSYMRVSLPRNSLLPRPVVQQRHETALGLVPSQQHIPASCVHEYPEVGVLNRVALDHHVLRCAIAVLTHAHLNLRIVMEVIVAQDGAKVQARQGTFDARAARTSRRSRSSGIELDCMAVDSACYSYLNASTGLARAATHVWLLTVASATTSTPTPASTNHPRPMSMR